MGSPQHDTVEQVYRWRRVGASIATIARGLGIPASTVHRWLANPHWHPEIDQVAIDDAYAGRWRAYENFTHWERDHFLDILDESLLSYALTGDRHWLPEVWAGDRWDTVTRHLRRRRQQR